MALIYTRFISLIFILALMAGCAQNYSGFWQNRYDPYTEIDFDELLSFGANMANVQAASRAELCRALLMRHRGPQDAGIQLYLMVGRLLSDSCGSIPKILEGVNAIPAYKLSDARLHSLISINTEALKRMELAPRRQSNNESQSSRVQNPKDSKGAKQDENRLLREKLEAIRAMEKQLDESSNGN